MLIVIFPSILILKNTFCCFQQIPSVLLGTSSTRCTSTVVKFKDHTSSKAKWQRSQLSKECPHQFKDNPVIRTTAINYLDEWQLSTHHLRLNCFSTPVTLTSIPISLRYLKFISWRKNWNCRAWKKLQPDVYRTEWGW